MADSENLSTMRTDLDRILKGPEKTERKFYILAALSDVSKLFKAACSANQETKSQTQFSKNFPEPAVVLVGKEKIKKSLKKVDYYLSFTKDYMQL